MSADRELLELAAKAAGAEYEPHDGWVLAGKPWNPRDDGDDALRLAAALYLHTFVGAGWAQATQGDASQVFVVPFETGATVDERAAALRSAILLAAAEIGRAMP